jgi:hypothetical protein
VSICVCAEQFLLQDVPPQFVQVPACSVLPHDLLRQHSLIASQLFNAATSVITIAEITIFSFIVY